MKNNKHLDFPIGFHRKNVFKYLEKFVFHYDVFYNYCMQTGFCFNFSEWYWNVSYQIYYSTVYYCYSYLVWGILFFYVVWQKYLNIDYLTKKLVRITFEKLASSFYTNLFCFCQLDIGLPGFSNFSILM